MDSIRFTRNLLITQANKLLEEYRAMMIFLAQMNSSTKQKFERQKYKVEQSDKRQLKAFIKSLNDQIRKIRSKMGATQPMGNYSELLKPIEEHQGTILLLPTYDLVGLFAKYPGLSNAITRDEIPLHASVEIDAFGKYPPRSSLEIAIYEGDCKIFCVNSI